MGDLIGPPIHVKAPSGYFGAHRVIHEQGISMVGLKVDHMALYKVSKFLEKEF
jgi:hypothetical protein